MKHRNPTLRSWLLALSAGTALTAHAGTINTTFSIQKGNLQQDGVAYGSGATYAGVVDGRVADNTATTALSVGSTAITLGNQYQGTAVNGQQYCGLFSYDLTELNSYIAANTGTYSSVAIQSVSFTLISSGGQNSNMTLALYGTDPFTSTGCTWANYTTGTAWTVPYQNLTPPNDTAAYGYTGGGSALTGSLGGTNPNTSIVSGSPLTWTSSANFISAVSGAMSRTDKTLYLTARGTYFNNGDNRVNVNMSPNATVALRPKLSVTLQVTTTAAPATWTGGSNTSWATAGNWSTSAIPATDAPITFNSSSTANLSTVLNQDFTVTSITVASPAGPVSVSGANKLHLGSGGVDLSAATQNLTVSAPVVLGGAQSWNVASGRTLGVSGAVTGSGDLTLAGAGKVSLGASNILPNGASAVNLIVSGTLDLNSTSQAVNGLSGSGIVDNTGGGASVLTVGNNNAAATFGGILQNTSGTLALAKTGTGGLVLTGASTYSGGFTNSGTGDVSPNNNGALGTGPVVFNAAQLYPTATTTFSNTLALNGSTLRIGGGASHTLTWNGPVTVTGTSGITSDGSTGGITLGSTLDITGATFSSYASTGAHNITGDISGAGGNLKATFGTLQLSGTGTYTGTTTVSGAAVLRLQPTGTISSNIVINTAGNLNIRNTGGWSYTGTITGDGTGSITPTSSTNATLAGPISGVASIIASSTNITTNTTVSGAISGATAVTVQGGTVGTVLTLSGDNSAMTGTVTINGATAGTLLNIKSATALGTGTLYIAGGNNGEFDNTSGSALTLSTNNVQSWGGDLTFVGTNDLNLGTGAVTLGGSRVVWVNAKTLTVGGAISGVGFGITKTNWGTLVLDGSSTYTGNTIIATGGLSINSIADYNSPSAIGAPASGAIQLGSGNNFCGLAYTGAAASTNRTVQLGDATPANTGVGAIQSNGSGALTFTAVNFNPTISGITGTRLLWLDGTYTGGTNVIQGIIQDNNGTTGKVSVGKGGDSSIWELSGVNTYTGGTIVQSGGSLKLGATGSIANSSSVSISAGGTFDTSAHATYAIPGTQTITFGVDATGSGSSGKIVAAGLNISNAVVTYSFTGTPNDPVYVLATYTSLTGAAFASVPAPPTGYTLNYAYEGNKIALVQGSVSGFSTWQNANSTAGGLNADHDNDGVSNGVEYFLGGTKNTTGFTALPGVINTSGTLSVTWAKDSTYLGLYTTDYVVETSTTLVGTWTPAALGAGANQVVISGNNVKYTFPTGAKNFARLKVTGP